MSSTEIILLFLFTAVIVTFANPWLKIRSSSEDNLTQFKVLHLEAGLRTQSENCEREIRDLKEAHSREVEYLKRYLEYLMLEMRALKGMDVTYKERLSLAPPLLLVCGQQGFCDQDENAITRAGMLHVRLKNATKDTLDEEIQRRRHSHGIYKYVHISAHGNESGLYMADGQLITGIDLATTFSGITLVFLAACSDIKVADRLIGAVKYVVSVREDVDSDVLEAFSFSFWRAIVLNTQIEDAFIKACFEVPKIASAVDLRKR